MANETARQSNTRIRDCILFCSGVELVAKSELGLRRLIEAHQSIKTLTPGTIPYVVAVAHRDRILDEFVLWPSERGAKNGLHKN